MSLPVHPAVNHFPVVASLLAAGCLLAGAVRPQAERSEWVLRALLLLGVAVVALPVVIGSGRAWSAAMGAWPWGAALPPRSALDGLLRWHVLGAAVSTALSGLGLGLGLGFRRGRIGLWPLLLVVLTAALATGITARVGGQMTFGNPESEASP